MKRKLKTQLYFLFFLLIIFGSCSDEYINEHANKEEDKKAMTRNVDDKEQYIEQFASILSKINYESPDVRLFLKNEAIKQFDKNYDILYYSIKDELVNGK